MKITQFDIPKNILEILQKQKIDDLRPSQYKAIEKGLFKNNNNLLVATPTGSGKTLVAELALLDTIINKKKRVVYIVPLKALASEKYREFINLYNDYFKIRIAISEIQNEKYNYDYNIIIVTPEKLDSLIRHNKNFIDDVGLLIVDEIHLLNDEKRGPTLEIILTIFKSRYSSVRIIGLSATIGNTEELSNWLEAILIEDDWRPVKLEQHVYFENKLLRYK